jgi:hypothetical protein
MDYSTLAIVLLGAICATLGWLWRQLWDAVQKLRKDLSLLEVDIARNYVNYDRLAAVLAPVLEGIHEIKATLRGKADKP